MLCIFGFFGFRKNPRDRNGLSKNPKNFKLAVSGISKRLKSSEKHEIGQHYCQINKKYKTKDVDFLDDIWYAYINVKIYHFVDFPIVHNLLYGGN